MLSRLGAVAKETLHRLRDASGNAVVEFTGLSVVLLIPLVYLLLTCASVQSASFAADTLARQIARVYSVHDLAEGREERIAGIVAEVERDYGVEVEARDIEVSCESASCPVAGEVVSVEVSLAAPIPGLGVIGLDSSIVDVKGRHALIAEGGTS